jgi:hypothetical protein
MRILTFSSPGGGQCGIGDYSAELSAALSAKGHLIDLIPLPRNGDRMSVTLESQRRIPNSDAAILHYDGSLYGDEPTCASRNFARIVSRLGNRPAIVFLHEGLPPSLPRRPLVKPWSSAFLPTWRGSRASKDDERNKQRHESHRSCS